MPPKAAVKRPAACIAIDTDDGEDAESENIQDIDKDDEEDAESEKIQDSGELPDSEAEDNKVQDDGMRHQMVAVETCHPQTQRASRAGKRMRPRRKATPESKASASTRQRPAGGGDGTGAGKQKRKKKNWLLNSAVKGTLLQAIMEAQLDKLERSDLTRLRTVIHALSSQGTLDVASLFTGTDIAYFCVAFLVSYMTRGQVVVTNLFSCESDGAKQQFLKKHIHPLNAENIDACVFKNVCLLFKGAATCAVHKQPSCPVPKGGSGPLLVSAGFSCKTISPLNRDREMARRAITHKVGTTGSTMEGLHTYVEEHTPPLMILENVAQILEPANVKVIRTMFESLGYTIAFVNVKAEKQGSCTPRHRAYVILLHRAKCGLSKQSASDVMARAKTWIEELDLDPVRDFESVLLPNDHPIVQRELIAMREAAAQDTRQDMKWPNQHLKHLSDAGLAASQIRLPERFRSSPWYTVMPARARQLLALKYHKDPTAHTYEVSQSMCRTSPTASSSSSSATATEAASNTLIPRSMVWVASRSRLLTGHEHLLCQGMPVELLDLTGESRNLLTDLAGNMFSAATYMAVLIGLLSSLPDDVKVDRELDDTKSDEELVSRIAACVSNLYSQTSCESDSDTSVI